MFFCIFVCLGALGALWAALGRSSGALGHSPGHVSGALGALLGTLGALLDALGPSWAGLGCPLGATSKKRSRGIKKMRAHMEPSWNPKSTKIDVKKRSVFKRLFESIFSSFLWFEGSKN